MIQKIQTEKEIIESQRNKILELEKELKWYKERCFLIERNTELNVDQLITKNTNQEQTIKAQTIEIESLSRFETGRVKKLESERFTVLKNVLHEQAHEIFNEISKEIYNRSKDGLEWNQHHTFELLEILRRKWLK